MGAAHAGDRNLANQARGRWGEERAAVWYRDHGAEVLDRNWRCDVGELDLVVGTATVTVFVEVKARADERFGPAAGAVDHRKQRRLRVLATRWLAEHPERRGPVRFDVVAVTGTRVDVIEGAF